MQKIGPPHSGKVILFDRSHCPLRDVSFGPLHQVHVWSRRTHTFALYNQMGAVSATAAPLWILLMIIRHMFLCAPDASGHKLDSLGGRLKVLSLDLK